MGVEFRGRLQSMEGFRGDGFCSAVALQTLGWDMVLVTLVVVILLLLVLVIVSLSLALSSTGGDCPLRHEAVSSTGTQPSADNTGN